MNDQFLALHACLGHALGLETLKDTLSNMGPKAMWHAPDLPAHGADQNWDRQSDYVETAMAKLIPLVDRPTTLFGHSLGGYLALALAVRAPQNIAGLILYEPVLFNALQGAAPDEYAQLCKTIEPFIEAFTKGDRREATRLFLSHWDPSLDWGTLHPLKQNYLIERIDIVAATSQALFEDSHHITARLDKITAPVLLLYGANAPRVSKPLCLALASHLPNAQAIAVEGAGHMGPLSHPQAVANNIQRFLNKNSLETL